MNLYVTPVAPNPTRVRLCVTEKKAGGAEIDILEVRIDLVGGEQNFAEHLARNPFGRVPVLELADGSHPGESLAIIEYLEECHPEPPMIGREPIERARVRELERIAELGVLQPVARIVHAPGRVSPSVPLGRELSRAPGRARRAHRVVGVRRSAQAGAGPRTVIFPTTSRRT